MASNPLESYWVLWAASTPQGQRRGQWAFNLLETTRPDLADRVRATPFDPFYDDNILPSFETWVYEHWNDILDGDG